MTDAVQLARTTAKDMDLPVVDPGPLIDTEIRQVLKHLASRYPTTPLGPT